MSTPTDGELSALVNGPGPFEGKPALVRLWLKPVESVYPTLKGTVDKPIGQFTMPELIAWGLTLAYLATSVALAETLAFNLARVALRGR